MNKYIKQNGGGYDDNVTIITVANYNQTVYDIDKYKIINAKEKYDRSIENYDPKTKLAMGTGLILGASGVGLAYKDEIKEFAESVGDLF